LDWLVVVAVVAGCRAVDGDDEGSCLTTFAYVVVVADWLGLMLVVFGTVMDGTVRVGAVGVETVIVGTVMDGTEIVGTVIVGAFVVVVGWSSSIKLLRDGNEPQSDCCDCGEAGWSSLISC